MLHNVTQINNMTTLVVFLVGVVVGFVAAFLVYRNNITKATAAVDQAKVIREKTVAELEALKTKFKK